jgi:hypothetical protein
MRAHSIRNAAILHHDIQQDGDSALRRQAELAARAEGSIERIYAQLALPQHVDRLYQRGDRGRIAGV